MAEAAVMADILSSIGVEVVSRLPEYLDIIFLDVQHALDGGSLCEQADSPANALANPIWFRDENGVIQRNIPSPIVPVAGNVASQWRRINSDCVGNEDEGIVGVFLRCRESGHPNEAGHAALGTCLFLAIEESDEDPSASTFNCSRDRNTGSLSISAT